MSSSLIASSTEKSVANMEGCPSGQREQTVNLPAYAYGGSNPPPSTGREKTKKFAGVAQLVEPQFSKLNVAGSSPVARSPFSEGSAKQHPYSHFRPGGSVVEHPLGKGEVVSSNLILGSSRTLEQPHSTNDEAGNERWLKKSLSGTNHT